MSSVLKIFIIYAREDLQLKNGLKRAFIPLERTGRVQVFHDALIQPGEKWEEIILQNLHDAQIVLPLISPNFFDSQFIHEVEFQKAKERHMRGENKIIPIILRSCGWKYDPDIGSLQVLPTDGKPVVMFTHQEEAWEQVLDLIHEITERPIIEAQQKQEEEYAKIRREQAEVYFKKGYNSGDLQDRIKYLSQAIEMDPDYEVAYKIRAEAWHDTQQYQEEIKDYDQIIRLTTEKSNWETYYNRGKAKSLIKKHRDAINDFEQVVRLKPDNGMAYTSIAIAYYFLKEYYESINWHDEAIRVKKSYSYPSTSAAYDYTRLGKCKEEIGLWEEAIEDYNSALQIKPDDENAKLFLRVAKRKYYGYDDDDDDDD